MRIAVAISGTSRCSRTESPASVPNRVWSPGFSRLRVDFANASKHFEISEQAPSHRLKPGLQASELRRPAQVSSFVPALRDHSSFPCAYRLQNWWKFISDRAW